LIGAGTEEYWLVSKNISIKDSVGGDLCNNTSPNSDVVTLPACDSFHLADWDC